MGKRTNYVLGYDGFWLWVDQHLVENDYVVGFAAIGTISRVAARDNGFATLEAFVKQVKFGVTSFDLLLGFD